MREFDLFADYVQRGRSPLTPDRNTVVPRHEDHILCSGRFLIDCASELTLNNR